MWKKKLWTVLPLKITMIIASKNTSAPSGNLTQLQTYNRLLHFKGSWYRLMYISVSRYKSCCQSQLFLSVFVVWKWNSYLRGSPLLILIVHSVMQLSSISLPAGHILNTLTVIYIKGGGGGGSCSKATQTLDIIAFTCVQHTPVTDIAFWLWQPELL